jgi:5-methyltetrahydrofolate--homocysteine methyltransferase
MSQELMDAIIGMREKDAVAEAERLLEAGTDPLEVLEVSSEAMAEIGRRFESEEYFIPELILAGVMLSQISDLVKPRLQTDVATEKLGKVVIGTVEGDIHDIAKDIVVFMLDAMGFEVYDLGVDVPAAAFVDKVKETGASVVALSGFLTLAYEAMRDTVSALREAGLDVKVMIGGGQIDSEVQVYTGADGWGKDAMTAVKLTREWYGYSGT